LGNVGCTDPTACNYDSQATLNDGSCLVDLGCGCGNPAAMNGFDCAGNCLAGVPILFTGGAANCSYAGFEITDCSGNVIAEMIDGCAGFDQCVVLPATYIISLSSAWNLNSDWGSLSIDGVLYGDDPADWPTGTGTNGQSIAIVNDYFVGGAVPGCTDATACNYVSTANCDDNSCTYPSAVLDCSGNCTADEITITLNDSYGDGWNQNSILIDGVSYTIQTGLTAVFTTCVDITSGCVDVEYVNYPGTSWNTENSWIITDAFGTVLDQGAPVYGGFATPTYTYTANFGQGCPVLGCTDPTACNYAPGADTDDGSCNTVYGCTDALACNYDATATCDDGSCNTVYGCMDNTTDNGDGTFGAANYDPLATCPDTLADGSSVCTYGIPGCTDALACNYDPLATADNGQCTYTVTGYDCAGVCLDDADGDGICDPFEVNGCTDALALNYSVLATDDD
jgi:hypothetical protein